MKKLLLIGALAVAFIASGCSEQTTVEVDGDATNASGDNTGTSGSGTGGSGGTAGGSGASGTGAGNAGGGSSEGLVSVYFRFDQFIIEGNENIRAVRDNATFIKNNNAYEVRVEGNTDEWGSDEYNYALALKRASSVKDALVNENIPVDKIKLVSYGESKPRCLEQNKRCWQENRRVDFVLIPQQ